MANFLCEMQIKTKYEQLCSILISSLHSLNTQLAVYMHCNDPKFGSVDINQSDPMEMSNQGLPFSSVSMSQYVG